MQFDLLIKGGRLVDPKSERDGLFDLAVRRDRIAAVDSDIPEESARTVVDARGRLVTPGLIDIHAHVMRGFSAMSIDADELGPRSGVTTFVDPGTVGAYTLPGFREFIVESSRASIFAFQNIAAPGLVGTDYELARLEWCSVPVFEKLAKANGDIVVGIKVRMGLPQFAVLGIEPLRRAREAGDRCNLPLMVHIAWAPPAITEVLEYLKEGDIVTHCATGLGMKLVTTEGKVLNEVRQARDRGVRFDIGHGSGSFSFATAEAFIAEGFLPDTVSTDAHHHSVLGPMFDLPTCMTKLLALGVDLSTVVGMATTRPVEVLGLPAEIGNLAPGAFADIAVFDLVEGDFPLFDFSHAERRARQMLRNVATIMRGRVWEPPRPEPIAPWMGATQDQKRWWNARTKDPRAPHWEFLTRPDQFDDPTPVERTAEPLPREQ